MPPSLKDLVPLGSLVTKPEQPPGPSCCLGLWQQPQRHDGTWSDTRPNPPSPKEAGLNQAGNCSMLSCSHMFLHSSRDLFLTGRKDHTAPDPNPTVSALERTPSPPSYWRCNTTCQSCHPKLQEPASERQLEKKPGSTLGYYLHTTGQIENKDEKIQHRTFALGIRVAFTKDVWKQAWVENSVWPVQLQICLCKLRFLSMQPFCKWPCQAPAMHLSPSIHTIFSWKEILKRKWGVLPKKYKRRKWDML